MTARYPAVIAISATATLALVGCTEKVATVDSAARSITVQASDGACEIGAQQTAAGPATFEIANNGTTLTEFYVYDEAGTKILTEKPNIGPGISANLVYDFAPGTYTLSCRPNGTGVGIRKTLTVGPATGAAASPALAEELEKATETYRAYVEGEVAKLIPATEQFADLVSAGDLDGAKELYPLAREHYERIEPIAESFVDLDYAIDIRADGIEPGKPWTGWHAIEKILWIENTTDGAEQLAKKLVRDTKKLAAQIPDLEINPSLIGNGASGLMEEVALGKVTGEEERYSHTDIWDFVANVEGAKAAFQSLEQAAAASDGQLAKEIAIGFANLEADLAALKQADGSYPFYTELSKDQIRILANRVDALSEPLSKLTAAVVS